MVRNFGIAISSTIGGIALRVLLMQMRRDPVDVESIARLELADAARKVRRELDGTVMELAHFRRSAQQSLSDGFEEIRRSISSTSDRLFSGLEELLQTSSQPITSASESASENLSALSERMGHALETSAEKLSVENERLSASATAITTALDDLVEKIGAMQTPDKVIEVRVQPFVEALSRELQQLQDSLREINQRSEKSAADSSQSTSRLSDSIDHLVTHVGEFHRSVNTLEELHAKSETRSNELSALSTQLLNTSASTATNFGSATTAVSADLRAAVEQLQSLSAAQSEANTRTAQTQEKILAKLGELLAQVGDAHTVTREEARAEKMNLIEQG